MDTAQFDSAAKQVSASAKTWTKDFGRIGQQATDLGRTLTTSLTLPLVGLATGAAKAAIDFESSFAGVRKTVEATEPEFKALAQAFRDLSKEIPINVNELNKIGEAAGALGIPKQEILSFTKTIALLGVTTNLTSEQAADAIARIQNIFGAAGQDTDRLASTLVALGNAGASTETEIVEMGQRIAGAGHSIGLTQAQVLSFASTLASVGINAEAGGSAISRIFLKMNDAVMGGGSALTEFARVAGVSTAQFKKAFEEDAANATVLFINGLARLKSQGENTNATMEGMVGKNIILKDTLNRLTGAGDLLTTQLALGNKAWQDNTALTAEAEERFKTTASQLTLLWNRIKDVGITLGNALLPAIQTLVKWTGNLIPIIENMAQWFSNLPGPVQATGLALLGVVAAAGPALYMFGQLAFAAQSLTAVFATNGIAMMSFRGIAAGLSAPLTSLFSVFGSGATAVTVLGRAFTVLMGPVGWIIGGASALLSVSGTWDELFRILKAGATIVYNIASAIGSFALGVIQWFGEITGLTEIVTGAFRVFSAVLKIVAEDIAWFMGKLATVMEGIAAVTGGIDREMAKIDVASPFKKLIESGLAPAIKSTDYLTEAQDKQAKSASALGAAQEKSAKEIAKAKKDAEKAAREHEQAIEKEKQALSALGLVTEEEVNEKIYELTQLQEAATRKGVPLVSSLKAQETVLKALAAKAKESGVEFAHLTQLIQELDRQIRELSPTPQALSVKMGLPAVISGLQSVSLETSKAAIDAGFVTDAYHAFGMKTPAELDAVARAARQHYEDLRDSGTATTDQLSEAWEQVLEAEKRGRKESVSVWKVWGKELIAIGQNAVRGLAASLLGMSGQTAQEHQRAAEEAQYTFEETTAKAQETFNETTQAAHDSYEEQVAAANEAYEEIVKKNFERLDEMKADESVTEQQILEATKAFHEQQREAENDRDRKLNEAHDKFLGDVKAAEDTMNGEIERSHQEMLDAKEAASHRWKDNLKDIWRELKESFKSVLVDMLSSFINDFLGGMIRGIIGANLGQTLARSLIGWATGSGSVIPGVIDVATGTGVGTGVTAAGVATGVGVAVATPIAAYAIYWMASEWLKALFGEHYTPDPTTEEQLQWLIDYFGPDSNQVKDFVDGLGAQQGGVSPDAGDTMPGVPSFSMGTRGQYMDFGSGTLAMLHGREKITPEGADIDDSVWGRDYVMMLDGEPVGRLVARHRSTHEELSRGIALNTYGLGTAVRQAI